MTQIRFRYQQHKRNNSTYHISEWEKEECEDKSENEEEGEAERTMMEAAEFSICTNM